MRKLVSSAVAAALLGTTMVASVTPAAADPKRDRFIEDFYAVHPRDDYYWRWRRGGWDDDDYYSWYHRHDHDFDNAAGVAAIFGLALGAAAAASGAANFEAYPGDQWDYQCSLKYNSYDPVSNTFLGYDGYRHPCQLP